MQPSTDWLISPSKSSLIPKLLILLLIIWTQKHSKWPQRNTRKSGKLISIGRTSSDKNSIKLRIEYRKDSLPMIGRKLRVWGKRNLTIGLPTLVSIQMHLTGDVFSPTLNSRPVEPPRDYFCRLVNTATTSLPTCLLIWIIWFYIQNNGAKK